MQESEAQSAFDRLASTRASVLRLIAVAILLAIGVNAVSDGIASILSPGQLAAAGAGMILLIILVTALLQVRRRNAQVTIYPQILIQDGEIVEIPGYAFSEDLRRTFAAGVAENAAIRHHWADGSMRAKDPDGDGHPDLESAAVALLTEAVECVFLNTLSSHLIDHFDATEKRYVKEYGRDELLSVVSSNRFLDLLTRPLEERIAFLGTEEDDGAGLVRIVRAEDENEEGELFMALKGDHVYQKLVLALPRGFEVRRNRKGSILLRGPLIDLELVTQFQGFGADFDTDMLGSYVGLSDDSVRSYVGIDSATSVEGWAILTGYAYQLRPRALLSVRAWKLYRWADSFSAALATQYDFGEFEKRIQWEALRAALRCFGGETRLRARRSSREERATGRASEDAARNGTDLA